jgi:predicted component of type VI protein secretion system
VIGKQSDIYVTLELSCSNPSQNRTKELCLIFDIKTNFNMNMTVEDFNLFLEIGEVTIESVQVTKDVIGMKNRDYQKVLQHIVNYAVANFNYARSESPIDLKPASSYIPLLREVIKLKASPYIQDEFLFIGFESRLNHIAKIN